MRHCGRLRKNDGDFTPPEYAGGGTISISSTADATDSYNEQDIEFGTTTDVSGSTNTDETFDDTDTSGDAADVWELSLGSYSTTLGAGSFSQTVADSTSDSETDVNAGTDDGGITTDDYDDTGDETDEHSSSYSFSASAPSGDMSETGQGTDIASDKQAISLAETGDYTTSATEMEPTDDNPDGDAVFNQSLAVSDDLVEWVHDSLIGTEQGEGVSLSGSADYAGNATENAFSDDTVDVDVAAGTDAQSGDYGSVTSVLADRGFSETGTDVFPDDAGGNDKLSATYSHENNYTSDEKDVGNYGNSSGGTETLTTSDIDSTDEDTVETLSDGRTFSSGDQPDTTVNQSGPASTPTGSEQAPTDGSVQQPPPTAAPRGKPQFIAPPGDLRPFHTDPMVLEYLNVWAQEIMRSDAPEQWMNETERLLDGFRKAGAPLDKAAEVQLRSFMASRQQGALFRRDLRNALANGGPSQPQETGTRPLTQAEKDFILKVMDAVFLQNNSNRLEILASFKAVLDNAILHRGADGSPIAWFTLANDTTTFAITLGGKHIYFQPGKYPTNPQWDEQERITAMKSARDAMVLIVHEATHLLQEQLEDFYTSYAFDGALRGYRGIDVEIEAYAIQAAVEAVLKADPEFFSRRQLLFTDVYFLRKKFEEAVDSQLKALGLPPRYGP